MAMFNMDSQQVCFECWAKLYEPEPATIDNPIPTIPRRVAWTEIGEGKTMVRVSTVLIGLNMNYSDIGPPIIFETMIFGPDNFAQERYATKEAALAGHDRAVAWAKMAMFINDKDEHTLTGEKENGK